MSRLHECKTKGIDNVESEPHWIGIFPTVGDRMRDLYLKAIVSPRAGARTKTKQKTAKASGHNYGDVRGWKIRNRGLISAKSKKTKDLKKASRVAVETMRGDAKKT